MIPNDVSITPDLVQEHGLKEDEYRRFLDLIGREPTLTELGIVSAMWNEHCSYKSSRLHLRTLPTQAPWVIQGPGENAGVIDIGDGTACVFKMESHNHPSFIEPYQGAATGVGGILRDVFTMGARPVAALNSLRFGAPDHPKTRHLVAGVVAGIGGYGNSFGVPTVGGSVGFHERYNGNILVNAMAVGLAKADEIFYAKATGVGNPIVYLGSKTGRDGIHGATMASAEFDDASEDKRPTVQVGDPFAEKLLLEACLELMASGSVIAIQDMGAAGLTCSAVEMGAKGDLGIELDLDRVPCREEGMTAYEMMLSESQERMLMVLKPGMEDTAEAIFCKWGLDFAVIGRTTDTLRFVVKHGAKSWPICRSRNSATRRRCTIGRTSPTHSSPRSRPEGRRADAERRCAQKTCRLARPLLQALGLGAVRPLHRRRHGAAARRRRRHRARRRRPEGLGRHHRRDAALLRGRPIEGGRQAVAEAWRNITAVGGRPLALTDNLNFGNPERPEVMGQFVGCVGGIGEAAGPSIFPSSQATSHSIMRPTGAASCPRPPSAASACSTTSNKHATLALKREGDVVLLVGESKGWLGQSLYLRDICGREEGAPPPVDLEAEKRNGEFVRNLIRAGLVDTVHDCSDGGLAVAVAEMAMAGGIGAVLPECPVALPCHAYLFGEDQGRYVIAVDGETATEILYSASSKGVPVAIVGMTGADSLTLPGDEAISVADLKAAHEGWLPEYMAQELSPSS